MPLFGFRTAGFHGWSVEQTAAKLASLGYDCLELCLEASDVRPESLDERRCAGLRNTFDRLGIAIVSLSYHGDIEPSAERRANQERAVEAARHCGAGILVINAEKSVEQGLQWTEHVSRLKWLCELAEKAGVVLALEPEPRLVVGSSEQMIEMLLAVGSPRLKVNFDLGHAQVTDGDPAASIRVLGDSVVHLHLEDIKDRVHKHLMFGEGDIDFAKARRALADIGYAGPYVADLFGFADPADTAARALVALREQFG